MKQLWCLVDADVFLKMYVDICKYFSKVVCNSPYRLLWVEEKEKAEILPPVMCSVETTTTTSTLPSVSPWSLPSWSKSPGWTMWDCGGRAIRGARWRWRWPDTISSSHWRRGRRTPARTGRSGSSTGSSTPSPGTTTGLQPSHSGRNQTRSIWSLSQLV